MEIGFLCLGFSSRRRADIWLKTHSCLEKHLKEMLMKASAAVLAQLHLKCINTHSEVAAFYDVNL